MEFFTPSGQLPLILFVVPEPLERNMVCTQGELVTKEVRSKVLDKVYNSQQLASSHAVLLFRLAQGSTCIGNYALCGVICRLR